MATVMLPMAVADIAAFTCQPSQRVQLGIDDPITPAIATDLAHGGEAWTAWRDGRAIACVGIRETFPGAQGVAWAMLSAAIGSAHLTITRHARRRIAESPLIRIEAIVHAARSADCAWARAVGLEPEALLRRFGAASEDHLLFTRIR